MVKAHLGKPDAQRANPDSPLRKSVELCRSERVQAAEDGPARSELKTLEEAVVLAKHACSQKNASCR